MKLSSQLQQGRERLLLVAQAPIRTRLACHRNKAAVRSLFSFQKQELARYNAGPAT